MESVTHPYSGLLPSRVAATIDLPQQVAHQTLAAKHRLVIADQAVRSQLAQHRLAAPIVARAIALKSAQHLRVAVTDLALRPQFFIDWSFGYIFKLI